MRGDANNTHHVGLSGHCSYFSSLTLYVQPGTWPVCDWLLSNSILMLQCAEKKVASSLPLPIFLSHTHTYSCLQHVNKLLIHHCTHTVAQALVVTLSGYDSFHNLREHYKR